MVELGKRKELSVQIALFISSLGIYVYHFHSIFFRFNTVLSSVTLDSIKNYYTFLYHIKNDTSWLAFSGMNYPFSEHAVYSDCQPGLGLLLKAMPFLHNHLIGVLHLLLFFSFIVSPLILYSVMRRTGAGQMYSFLVSLAIGLLSPQFLKINAGHHALAYGFMIPLSIYLQQLVLDKSVKNRFVLLLTLYHLFVFSIHPYMGLVLCLFSGLTGLGNWLINEKVKLSKLWPIVLTSLLPILTFSLMMKLTDSHTGRTSEPYGTEVMIESPSSLIAPDFGPFKTSLEQLLPEKPAHFEGHSYLGIVSVVASLLFFLCLPFIRKKIVLHDAVSIMFYASIVILFIAFGYHQKILKSLSISSAFVNQFRAVSRFAWIFYFTLPLFVFTKLHEYLSAISIPARIRNSLLYGISIIYCCVNLVESSAMFHLNESAYWKFRNFFNSELLTSDEKNLLADLTNNRYQAILPLPYFHGGSEMYDRNGASASMAPSMLFSYHSGLPIYSVMMSRTSIHESEAVIDLFNLNHIDRKILPFLNDKPFLVLLTRDPLLPDEERLLKKINFTNSIDSLSIGTLSIEALKKPLQLDREAGLDISNDTLALNNHCIYIRGTNKPPYTNCSINDLHTLFVLDSLQLPSGHYVMSMRYYYSEKNFQSVSANVIVTENLNGNYIWRDMLPIRKMSGFYDTYAIFEETIELNSKAKYEFLIQGYGDKNLRISDFMVRPDTLHVYCRERNGTITYDNFPAN